MIPREEPQMIVLLQLQRPKLHPESTSLDPGNPASAMQVAPPLQGGRQEGQFHTGCDRSISTDADPVWREVGHDTVSDQHLA